MAAGLHDLQRKKEFLENDKRELSLYFNFFQFSLIFYLLSWLSILSKYAVDEGFAK